MASPLAHAPRPRAHTRTLRPRMMEPRTRQRAETHQRTRSRLVSQDRNATFNSTLCQIA